MCPNRVRCGVPGEELYAHGRETRGLIEPAFVTVGEVEQAALDEGISIGRQFADALYAPLDEFLVRCHLNPHALHPK